VHEHDVDEAMREEERCGTNDIVMTRSRMPLSSVASSTPKSSGFPTVVDATTTAPARRAARAALE